MTSNRPFSVTVRKVAAITAIVWFLAPAVVLAAVKCNFGDPKAPATGCFADQADCEAKLNCTSSACGGKQCFCQPDASCTSAAAAAAAATKPPAKTMLVDPLGNITIRQLVGRATNLLMGLSGSFALLAFVYGGFKMITAGGNEKKYAEGLNSLKWAVIGLLVIFGSFILLNALFAALGTASS